MTVNILNTLKLLINYLKKKKKKNLSKRSMSMEGEVHTLTAVTV